VRVFAAPGDVLAAVGERLGPGEWLEVDQQRVDAFVDATGDRQWVRGVPGYLALALIPTLAAGVVTYEGCAARVNYGADKVRLGPPLPVGARIRVWGEIVDAARTAGGVRVVVRWTLETEDTASASGVCPTPACVADTVVLLAVHP